MTDGPPVTAPVQATVGTGISFVVPFWNEADGAQRTIAVLADTASALCERGLAPAVEVVAVDDGSTDGTADLLDDLARADPRIRPVHHRANLGFGAALRTGFEAAALDWIFYTDADLPVDPTVCVRALRAAELHGGDIVSCYRLDRTGEGTRRAVLSAGYNAAVRAVTGLAVRDVNFAAKLVRRAAVIGCLPTSDSLFFDAELLARAQRGGATVQQIGVDYFPRTVGTSTLSSLSVIRATARDLLRTGPRVRVR